MLLLEDPASGYRGLNHLGKAKAPIGHGAHFDPTQHARGPVADHAPGASIENIERLDRFVLSTAGSAGHRRCSAKEAQGRGGIETGARIGTSLAGRRRETQESMYIYTVRCRMQGGGVSD